MITSKRPGRLRRVESAVRRYFLDNYMRPADGRVLLAVSGGADSTALLLVLNRLSRDLQLGLHIAHFDHGLRGPEVSAKEEGFVRELATALGLPLSVGRGAVRTAAREQRLSLEDAARRQRYAFLAGVAGDLGIGAVATGHTASDQAETVLMHLVRGAGLQGLAGMPPVSPWPFEGHPGLSLIRPLLAVSGRETRAYCRAEGVQAVEDETNQSMAFRRNRVRAQVLPLLRELNPRVDEALVRLAASVRDDLSFLDEQVRELLLPPEGDGATHLSRAGLMQARRPLRQHAFRLAVVRLTGGAADFTARHFEALEKLVLEGRTGDRLDLPRHLKARLLLDRLEMRRQPLEARIVLPPQPVSLPVPGRARVGFLVASACSLPDSDSTSAEVSRSAVGDSLLVRRRRPGDRFQPAGMSENKKLQDFFVDAHVPREQRDSVPLFESSRGIVWVGGLRVAEWARPRESEATVFLSFRPVED